MSLEDIITLCKSGKQEEAVKQFKGTRCVRETCQQNDLSSCLGCLRQLLLYESLYRFDPAIEETLSLIGRAKSPNAVTETRTPAETEMKRKADR